MGTATNEIDIDRPANDVWKLVRDFGGLAGWMPGIDSCRVEDNDRILEMMGMELTETLVRCDDNTRTLVYSIAKSPLPIEHHEATIAVTSTGDASCHVTYGVEVRPDSMVDVMSGAYAGALRALKSRVETDGQP
jgi:polyketide cyclase/dehydrase/lipid transport protein